MHCTIASATMATSTSNCSSTPVLVDPELLKFSRLGSLCKVQMMSKELELDAYKLPIFRNWHLIS